MDTVTRPIGQAFKMRLDSGTSVKHIVCECQCGKVFVTSLFHSKKVQSCGCITRQKLRNKTITHGMSKTSIYKVWIGMIARCTKKNSHRYHSHGSRGISVCERWMEFTNFFEDMGHKPLNLSLDRIDNNAGYCKENCRWATTKEQSRNMRSNRYITIDGVTRILTDWCKEEGTVNQRTVRKRLKRGWSIESAIFK